MELSPASAPGLLVSGLDWDGRLGLDDHDAVGTPGDDAVDDLLTVVLAGLDRAAADDAVVQASRTATPTLVTPRVLEARVDALAAALVAAGVRPRDAVVVTSARSAGMVVAFLAVLRAGATVVPVDVAAPLPRAVGLARQVSARAVVGSEAWARQLAGAAGAVALPVDDDGRPGTPGVAVVAWPARRTTDTAYVLFTSGSTGTPKGVRVSDGAVVARIASYREVLADGGVRLLAHSPLTFDASIYLLWALAVGGTLVVRPTRRPPTPSR